MNFIHHGSKFLTERLPHERVRAIRAAYMGFKRRLNPLTKLIYGTFTTEEFREHLEEKVGRDFEILMVHGSMNHMSPMYSGSALELVKMLKEYCGPERTLVMPAFYFGSPEHGSIIETFQANPNFDLKRTASQTGIMTELFRRGRDVLQSRHPVYRVAATGPLADDLVRGHEEASAAAGVGSPFEFMARHDTLIIGIGKSFDVMTQVHFVEELLGEEFPAERIPAEQRSRTQVTVLDGGDQIPVVLQGNGIKWRFNIDRLPDLLQPGDLQCWRFHNVPLFAARAKTVTDRLVAAAKQGKSLYEPR